MKLTISFRILFSCHGFFVVDELLTEKRRQKTRHGKIRRSVFPNFPMVSVSFVYCLFSFNNLSQTDFGVKIQRLKHKIQTSAESCPHVQSLSRKHERHVRQKPLIEFCRVFRVFPGLDMEKGRYEKCILHRSFSMSTFLSSFFDSLPLGFCISK